MCILVLGQRRCALCDLIIKDNILLPLDKRFQQCELKGQKHDKVVYINYIPFVCACCKESERVKMLRAKNGEGAGEGTGVGDGGKKLDPEAEEFVPESVKAGRKVIWVGGWWVEE